MATSDSTTAQACCVRVTEDAKIINNTCCDTGVTNQTRDYRKVHTVRGQLIKLGTMCVPANNKFGNNRHSVMCIRKTDEAGDRRKSTLCL